MLAIKQQRLLTFSPLPIVKQQGQDTNMSRLDQQISFYNSYIQKKMKEKKKRTPFQCRYPLRIDATQLSISPKKETNNTKILLNRKNLYFKEQSCQNSVRTIMKDKQSIVKTKNSISRWDEQQDEQESFYLYNL